MTESLSPVVADAASSVPEYLVVVTEKGGQERQEAFRAPELTIGRVHGNDLVLPKGNVSKRHARILYREGRFIVTDLNSTNGTYVNRRRITQATIIRDGDKIYVGDFVIRIESRGEADTSEPPTPSSAPHASPVPAGLPEDFSTGNHSALPGWERPSAFEEARASSGPPKPTDASSTPDMSSAAERFSDLSAGHREGVLRLVEIVKQDLGEPPLEPDETLSAKVREKVSQVSDQLMVDGQIPVGTSADAIGDQAISELLHLGPLTEILEDDQVSMISAARFDELVVTRDGRQQTVPPGFSCAASLDLALRRLCAKNGRDIGAQEQVDLHLSRGEHLALLRGAVAPTGPLFTLQKPRRINSSLDDLVKRGAVSRSMATFLAHCVTARLNILVIGPRGGGAHTVLSALCDVAGRDRVVIASDFDDIAADREGAVRVDLSAQGADVRRIVDIASGLSQARLAMTLSTPKLAVAALEAMGAGSNGVMASLRGSTLARGLMRFPADIASMRPDVGLEAAAGWVLSSFDLGVEVARLRDGRIRVLRVGELAAGVGGTLECHDIFRFTVSRVTTGGAVEGNFSPTGYQPRVASQLLAAGIRIEGTLFSRPPTT